MRLCSLSRDVGDQEGKGYLFFMSLLDLTTTIVWVRGSFGRAWILWITERERMKFTLHY